MLGREQNPSPQEFLQIAGGTEGHREFTPGSHRPGSGSGFTSWQRNHRGTLNPIPSPGRDTFILQKWRKISPLWDSAALESPDRKENAQRR